MLCDLDTRNRHHNPPEIKQIWILKKNFWNLKNIHVSNDLMDFQYIQFYNYKLDVVYFVYRNLKYILHLFHMDLVYRDLLL